MPPQALISLILIDCENLTSPRQLAAASRWRGDAAELFGRRAHVERWRARLAELGIPVRAETLVPDDAPSQAADEAIRRRAHQLGAGPLAIASNDQGFRADVAALQAAGIAARLDLDPSDAGLLRLVVAELGPRAGLGAVGEALHRRFGIRLKGRAGQLARAAGLELDGQWLRLTA